MDSFNFIYWIDLFIILGVLGLFYCLYSILKENPIGPNQTQHYVASDLDLHSLSYDPFTDCQARMGKNK